MKIVGISGSLRRDSFNTKLLRAVMKLAPPEATIEPASIRGIPLYDGDLEAERGIPPAAQELKEKLVASNGLLIATPEYNNSIPGVLKNAIDWLSRPAADIRRVFGALPVAIIGATTGPGGTSLSQAAWLPVLRTLGTAPWFGGRVLVSNAAQAFDAEGEILDPGLRARLATFVAGFAQFVAQSARGQSVSSTYPVTSSVATPSVTL